MRTAGNTILLTGGGGGIGRELARRFQALGNKVIITGRRAEALEETIGDRADMVAAPLDVTDEAAVVDFALGLVEAHPSLNILVNNAGIMRREQLTADPVDTGEVRAIVETNLLAPIMMTALLLPHLRSRPDAAVVNVTSGLAFVPLAATPTYSATKAALHSYTSSLRWQLRGTGVEVVEIIPPAIRTTLMPEQATNERMMPLADYIDEAMALLCAQPTPTEVCVERVGVLRDAAREGRFDEAFVAVNSRP